MIEHKDWVDRVSNSASNREISRMSGVPMRTIYNQIEKGNISAENVIAIAIAYGHHPVGALVDTGYLEEKWAQHIDPAHALRTVTEDELADEVLRRMKIGVEAGGSLDTPLDELAEQRSKKNSENYNKTSKESYDYLATIPNDAVADSSPEQGGTPEDYEP